MSSVVAICNRALQKLGAARIRALDEDTPNARSCAAAYEIVRDAELRAHPWAFAIARVVLAPVDAAPVFGYGYAYPLPADCLRALHDPDGPEWRIEGKNLLSDEGPALRLRYIRRAETPTDFDALFVEALACRLAVELAEEITQSNTKKADAAKQYRAALAEAQRANAIERAYQIPATDDWLLARY